MTQNLLLMNQNDCIRGIINIKDASIQIGSENITKPLQLENNFCRRLLHSSKYVTSRQQNYSFKQIHWVLEPNKTDTHTLMYRTVTLIYKDGDHVDFIIEKFETANHTDAFPFIDTKLLDYLDDVILITDAETEAPSAPFIIYANKSFQRMTGFSLEETFGRSPRLLQGSATSATGRAKIREALKNWESVTVELLNYNKDGSTFTVELRITPVTDETGWYTHWLSIQRDITAAKINEAVRITANRALTVETLASGIAHNVNNQIATVAGRIALIKQGLDHKLPSELQHYLQELKLAESKLINIKETTSQFMNLSKATSSIIKMTDIARELKKLIQLELGSSGIQLDFEDKSANLSTVDIDYGLISVVISNIILNSKEALANKTSDSKNKITVCLHYAKNDYLEGKFLRVTIADNGPGIHEKIRDKLFLPFVTTKDNGMGLGLFAAQTTMTKAGGYIALLKTSHEGTEFEIGIPLHLIEKSEKVDSIDHKLTWDKLSTDLPVLIIEDQIELADMYCELIELNDLKAEACYDAQTAIEKIQAGNYSLIISDLNLGGIFKTDKILLTAKEKNKQQKVALMSGGDIRQDHRITNFLTEHPDTLLLNKPFDIKLILDLFQS